MLILVVVLFLICWGPRLIFEIIMKCCLSVFNHGTYSLRIVFYLLPFVHSCLNPIVYGFMSSKFRRRMVKFFERSCTLCHKRDGQVSRIRSAASTSVTRNGTSRIASTYTFSSFAPSMSVSPVDNKTIDTQSIGL